MLNLSPMILTALSTAGEQLWEKRPIDDRGVHEHAMPGIDVMPCPLRLFGCFFLKSLQEDLRGTLLVSF